MRKPFVVLIAAAAFVPVACFGPAQARWKSEYATVPAEVQAWYHRQQTTPETRRRLSAEWYRFCCDHADTVSAKFVKTDGRWMYQTDGSDQWQAMPDDIVQPDVMTPSSKPVLFVDATFHQYGPVCFFPGGTGT
jgi:hypothetical protein